MKNKNLPYLIGGGLLLLGVGGYFIYKYISDKNKSEKSNIDDAQVSKSEISNLSDSFPITKGTMNNKNVRELQVVLEFDDKGKSLVFDGSWGDKTEGAMNVYGFGGYTILNMEELNDMISKIEQKKIENSKKRYRVLKNILDKNF